MSRKELQPTEATYRPASERLSSWLTDRQGKSPEAASALIKRIEVFQSHASNILDSQTTLWVFGKPQTETEPTVLRLHLLWPDDVVSEERKRYGTDRLSADFNSLVGAGTPSSTSDIIRELDFVDETPHEPELEYLGCFGLTPEEEAAAARVFYALGEYS